jgi:etoposide-induced 2.4 mRNA
MLFLLSLIFYNYVFLPTLRFFIVKIFGEFNSDINSVWSTIESILYFLFQSVWIVPFFAVSKIINNLYFQNIGQTAYKYSRGRPSVSLSLSKTIADFIFSSVVEILFLIQADVITYIHFYHMQHVLYSVHLSLLYSLYAFEYKWIEMGWEIDRRLTYIEIHWIYFIGYGLPLALTTQVFNYWIIKACIFSILFPFYIVGANEATPKMVEFCAHIKFFSPVVTISNSIFSVLRRNNKLSGQRNLTQPRR